MTKKSKEVGDERNRAREWVFKTLPKIAVLVEICKKRECKIENGEEEGFK